MTNSTLSGWGLQLKINTFNVGGIYVLPLIFCKEKNVNQTFGSTYVVGGARGRT